MNLLLLTIVLSHQGIMAIIGSAAKECASSCGIQDVHYPFGLQFGCGDPSHLLKCTGNTLVLTLNNGADYPLTILYPDRKLEIRSPSSIRNLLPGIYFNNFSESCSPNFVPDRRCTTEVSWYVDSRRAFKCAECVKSGGTCGYTGYNSTFFLCITDDEDVITSQPPTSLPLSRHSQRKIAAISASAICSLLIFGCCCKYVYRFRLHENRQRRSHLAQRLNDFEARHIYSYKDLHVATQGFNEGFKLGSGGFGTVYKGILQDGTVVAIKRSKSSANFGVMDEQFLNEITILSQVNHRNLVKLKGWCMDTRRNAPPLLVYEYVTNGTLLEHLQCKRGVVPLGWEQRLQIAIETAEALAYLHSVAAPPIYHRDVKSSNILLDDSLSAKVADFGISKLVGTGDTATTHVSTLRIQGTPGYCDPELMTTFRLTDKSDVYSFGVVLLELVTGQKPLDFGRESSRVNLAFYSLPLIRMEMIEELVDPKMGVMSAVERCSVARVAALADKCLAECGANRPKMREVVEELTSIREEMRSFLDSGEVTSRV